MPVSEAVAIAFGDITLAATIDWNAAKDKPTILSLHGGGVSGKERAAYLTKELAEAGLSCLRFDFSGWGESGGVQSASSLKQRFKEALTVMELLDASRPVMLIATSMGAATAMELTRHLEIDHLVLFCPALYARDAFDVPFGDAFTTILHRKDSFNDADTALLENYTGTVLHLIGEDDDVIPQAVTDLYEQHLIHARDAEFLMLEKCGHNVHAYLQENPHVRQAIIGLILDRIQA